MFGRARKPAQRDAAHEMVHAYWPDICWVLNGDGREFHEFSHAELETLGRFDNNWVQLPVLARLPLTYGDGRVYVTEHDGKRFLLINGSEYGSSAARLTPEVISLIAHESQDGV